MENYSTTNGQQDSFPRGQSNGIDLPTTERNNNGGSSSTATAAVVNIPTTFAALLDSFPLPVLSVSSLHSRNTSATQHDISGSNPHPVYSNNHHRTNVATTPPTANVSLLPSSSLRASSSDSIIPNPSELLLRSPSQAARAVDDHFAAIRTSSEQTPVSTSRFGPAAAVTTPDKSLSYHHGGHNSHSMPAKKRVGQRQQSPLTTASTTHSAYSPLPPSSPQTHTRLYVDSGNKGNHSSTTGSDNSVSPSSANTMSPRITTTAHHHSHPRTHPHSSSLTSKRSRPPVAAIDIPQKKMKMAQLDTSLPVNTSEQDASANQGTQQQQNCNQGTEAVSPPASQLSYQFHQFANQMMTRFEQMLTIQSEYYKKMFSTLDEALYRIAKVESKVAELEKMQAVDPSSVKMELHEMETNETTEALKPPQ